MLTFQSLWALPRLKHQMRVLYHPSSCPFVLVLWQTLNDLVYTEFLESLTSLIIYLWAWIVHWFILFFPRWPSLNYIRTQKLNENSFSEGNVVSDIYVAINAQMWCLGFDDEIITSLWTSSIFDEVSLLSLRSCGPWHRLVDFDVILCSG